MSAINSKKEGEVKMNKKEKIEELKKQIAELENPRLVLEMDDLYWMTCYDGYVTDIFFSDSEEDFDNLENNLCHWTCDEQVEYAKYQRAIICLKNWIREHNEGWKPDFSDPMTDKLHIIYDGVDKSLVLKKRPYFTK